MYACCSRDGCCPLRVMHAGRAQAAGRYVYVKSSRLPERV